MSPDLHLDQDSPCSSCYPFTLPLDFQNLHTLEQTHQKSCLLNPLLSLHQGLSGSRETPFQMFLLLVEYSKFQWSQYFDLIEYDGYLGLNL